jgi:hypothetical protein
MSLDPSVPLGNECYIQLFLPTDLEVQFKSVIATGIFHPKGNSPQLSTSDLNILPPSGSEKRQSILFFGCNKDTTVGETPYGSAEISAITSQKAKMDSGPFALSIFKDEDRT